MDHADDSTRRALLAALTGGLAGGLALAAPAPVAAKRGKKKAKPPLAVAMAHIEAVSASGGTVDPGILIAYRLAVLEFASGAAGNANDAGAFVSGGTAKAIRADLVRSIGQFAAELIEDVVPADRIAVLLV